MSADFSSERILTLPVDVKLEPFELVLAASSGTMRNVSAIKKGLANQSGLPDGKDCQVHCEGACGELALAKCFGVYWNGSINTFKRGGDVLGWEVRTRSQHDYDLIVRPRDNPDSIYWLVTGTAPSYRIHGWIKGSDAKQDGWMKTHGGRAPAYFAPQSALHREFELSCLVASRLEVKA